MTAMPALDLSGVLGDGSGHVREWGGLRGNVRFSKWHALGNGYLVVERAVDGTLGPVRARRMCDVRYGVGSDGVVEIVAAEGSRAEIVIWNPDGSSSEFSNSGSGSRRRGSPGGQPWTRSPSRRAAARTRQRCVETD